MADRYWRGGSGTWDGANTANWSSSSGGAGGASVPSPTDRAFFDSNSGTGTVTIGSSAACQVLFVNTSSNSLSMGGASAIQIYQSANLISGAGTFTNLAFNFLVNGVSGACSFHKQIGSISSSFGAGTTFNFNSDVLATNTISVVTSTNGSFGNTSIFLNGYKLQSTTANIVLNAGAYNNGTATISCASAPITAVNGQISITTSGSASIAGGVRNIGTTQAPTLYVECFSGGQGVITFDGAAYGFNGVTITNSSAVGGIGMSSVFAELNGASVTLTNNSTGTLAVNGNIFVNGNLTLGSNVTAQTIFQLGNGARTLTINGTAAALTLTSQGGFSGNSVTLTGSGSVGTMTISSPYTTVNFNSNFTTTTLNASGSSPGSLNITGLSSPRTLTATSYTLSNVRWTNITAAGTIPFTGTGFVDGGGNTNIQFVLPQYAGLFFGSNF
jgi:hypothetical protein